ncbi:MAG: hypothetical protein KIT34_04830 [Cyanobacteria bacterium TGS_CYA1]|nr:hypothetical protein [Cyanobacteria bacterium TGS_CYA1]
MKKLPVLFISLVSLMGLALPASAQNANAKGGFYNYKPGELQKPEWRQYKGEIHIIKDVPVVKDFTKPDAPAPIYQIQIPNHQTPQGGGLGINGSNSGGNAPQVINLTPTRDNRLLAPAGMESNMNSLRSPSQNLAPGVTTGVHSNMRPPQTKPSSLTPKSGKHELLNKTLSPKVQSPPSTYKEYEKLNASGAGSNSSSTKLTGELKNAKRGSLLKNSN